MKMCKIFILLIGMSLLLFFTSGTVSADSFQDPMNDVAHWAGYLGTWGWTDIDIGDHPNVDIKEIRQSIENGKMVIELEVYGSIQDSQLYYYYFAFNTSDAYYMVTWSNGAGGGLGMNTAGQFITAQPDISKSGATISATFDLVGEAADALEFWGYAWQYTNFGDIVNAEWWGDWVPNTYQPFDEDDIPDDEEPEEDEPDDEESGGDDLDDDKENGNNNGSQGTSDTKGSPGFGVIVLVAGLLILIFVLKRKK